MPISAQQYFKQLLLNAGIAESEITPILSRAEQTLNSTQIRTEDEFKSIQGRLTAETQRISQYEDWYNKTALPQFTAMQARVTELERNGGNPNPPDPGIDTTKFLTKEDLQAQMTDLQSRFGNVLRDGISLASSHAARFKEALPVEDIEKLAIEKGLTLRAAYQEYIKPREEQIAQERFNTEKQQAVDDALAAERAKRPPIDSVRSASARSPLFRRDPPTQSDQKSQFDPMQLEADMVNIYNTGVDPTATT